MHRGHNVQVDEIEFVLEVRLAGEVTTDTNTGVDGDPREAAVRSRLSHDVELFECRETHSTQSSSPQNSAITCALTASNG